MCLSYCSVPEIKDPDKNYLRKEGLGITVPITMGRTQQQEGEVWWLELKAG